MNDDVKELRYMCIWTGQNPLYIEALKMELYCMVGKMIAWS